MTVPNSSSTHAIEASLIADHTQKLFSQSCSRQSLEHEVAHGQINHCLTGTGMELVIFTQPSIMPEPGKGALHNPAVGQHLEDRRLVPLFDDIDQPPILLTHPRHEGTFINTICPDPLDAWQHPACDLAQYPTRSIPILDIGGMDDDRPDQSEGVNQHVPFASFYAFAGIVAAWPPFAWSSPTGCRGNQRTRGPITSGTLPHALAQSGMRLLPGAIQAPQAKVRVSPRGGQNHGEWRASGSLPGVHSVMH